MAYDFTDLSVRQQWLLTYQGWRHGDSPQPPLAKTVKPLIDRGLLLARQVERNGAQVTEYEVPLPVHAAWCAHCAEA